MLALRNLSASSEAVLLVPTIPLIYLSAFSELILFVLTVDVAAFPDKIPLKY